MSVSVLSVWPRDSQRLTTIGLLPAPLCPGGSHTSVPEFLNHPPRWVVRTPTPQGGEGRCPRSPRTSGSHSGRVWPPGWDSVLGTYVQEQNRVVHMECRLLTRRTRRPTEPWSLEVQT